MSKTLEQNLPALKAVCDDQARRHLEMYQIMKSCFQIIEDMQRRPDLCVLRQEGARQIRRNLVEYFEIFDKAGTESEQLLNIP